VCSLGERGIAWGNKWEVCKNEVGYIGVDEKKLIKRGSSGKVQVPKSREIIPPNQAPDVSIDTK